MGLNVTDESYEAFEQEVKACLYIAGISDNCWLIAINHLKRAENIATDAAKPQQPEEPKASIQKPATPTPQQKLQEITNISLASSNIQATGFWRRKPNKSEQKQYATLPGAQIPLAANLSLQLADAGFTSSVKVLPHRAGAEIKVNLETQVHHQPVLESTPMPSTSTAIGAKPPQTSFKPFDNVSSPVTKAPSVQALILNTVKEAEITTPKKSSLETLPVDKQGQRIIAESKNQDLELLDFLSNKHNLPDNTQKSLQLGLRRAAAKSQHEDIKFFIQKVTDINGKDDTPGKQKTALHWAIINNATECVKLLLDAGARADIPDAQGRTARNYAEQNKNTELLALLDSHSQQVNRHSPMRK